MNNSKKSDRHFKKYQAEAIFTTDIEKYIKEYKTTVPKTKLSKKSKANALVKVVTKLINDI